VILRGVIWEVNCEGIITARTPLSAPSRPSQAMHRSTPESTPPKADERSGIRFSRRSRAPPSEAKRLVSNLGFERRRFLHPASLRFSSICPPSRIPVSPSNRELAMPLPPLRRRRTRAAVEHHRSILAGRPGRPAHHPCCLTKIYAEGRRRALIPCFGFRRRSRLRAELVRYRDSCFSHVIG